MYLITFFNVSFGAVNNKPKKADTTKTKTATPISKKVDNKSKAIDNKKITKKVETVKTPPKNQKKTDNKITKPVPKDLNGTKTPVKPVKTLDKKNVDKKNPENKKIKKTSVKKNNLPNSNNDENLNEVDKKIRKAKDSIEKGIYTEKENPKLLNDSQKKDERVDRVKLDKITKVNSEKVLSFTKNSEEILAGGTMVSTDNYKILFTGINETNSDGSGEITKSTKLNTSFILGFQVKKTEIELESVKVYLVTSERNEKLLISSKVPEKREKREKNKPFVEEWVTEVGKVSKIKGFGSEKESNLISWSGESSNIGSVNLKNVLKDTKVDLEKVKVTKLKDLFALSDKKYRYLFKFVIKAKGKEEEVIFQPGILNVKLTGGKNIK
ncbi:hypothetical protein J5A73_06820 [Leptotrichia sp. oral taxon 218]|uniref:hypothetical protein n=1 Tax=Leptotrichia sp. oral taxon 218 TaxID=712361 RepID=UPI001B8B287C|nr:hypothetical protein [Leptotrichia sp. oral taxon 218]QUB94766.1 hypothetical protein J5A73_06820 [Leptotrichia sp. oral taxon 218]